MSGVRSGTVQRYLAARGFGFIQPDEGSEPVFFHVSAFNALGGPPPITGEPVTYSIPSQVAGTRAGEVVRSRIPQRLTGDVTNYNPVRGYGFVQVATPGAPRYYLHKSEILSRTEPARGVRVDFYASSNPVTGEAPRACYVTVIS